MRCLLTQVLQGLQLMHVPVDQSFQPTSNARNEFMLKDVTDFSQHIRTIEKDLRAMQKQITGAYCAWRWSCMGLVPGSSACHMLPRHH